MNRIRTYFETARYQTSLAQEFLAGTTTFVTMAYIVAVNPAILGDAGMPFDAVLFATVFCSAVSCIIMGVWANKPFALAPGMGMNAYFTYYVVQTIGVSWQTALAIVFISGLLFFILTISRIRSRIIDSIPLPLKTGIAVAVGIFIALIGLRTAGILEYEGGTFNGIANVLCVEVLLVVIGIALMAALHRRKIHGSILIGIAVITVAAIFLKIAVPPEAFISVPHGIFDCFLEMDFRGALNPKLWNLIIAFFMIDFFSSVGTFIGVSLNTNLLDECGRLPKMKEALMSDSIGTMFGAAFGTSSITTYIETAAGVREGGRTGITALVVAAWMLPMLLLSPILKIVPSCATAPALIFVGILMMAPLKTIKSYDIPEKIAFFILIIATSLTFSIDQGMLYGFSAYILLKCAAKKRKDISGFLCLTTGILIIGNLVQLV